MIPRANLSIVSRYREKHKSRSRVHLWPDRKSFLVSYHLRAREHRYVIDFLCQAFADEILQDSQIYRQQTPESENWECGSDREHTISANPKISERPRNGCVSAILPSVHPPTYRAFGNSRQDFKSKVTNPATTRLTHAFLARSQVSSGFLLIACSLSSLHSLILDSTIDWRFKRVLRLSVVIYRSRCQLSKPSIRNRLAFVREYVAFTHVHYVYSCWWWLK